MLILFIVDQCILFYSSFFFIISFKDVRDSMGDQARQCDIFKKIASQWKEMSPEEKKPFEDQVKNLIKLIKIGKD